MVFNTYLLLKTKIVDEKKAEKYKSSQFVNFDNLIEGMPGNIG